MRSLYLAAQGLSHRFIPTGQWIMPPKVTVGATVSNLAMKINQTKSTMYIKYCKF